MLIHLFFCTTLYEVRVSGYLRGRHDYDSYSQRRGTEATEALCQSHTATKLYKRNENRHHSVPESTILATPLLLVSFAKQVSSLISMHFRLAYTIVYTRLTSFLFKQYRIFLFLEVKRTIYL